MRPESADYLRKAKQCLRDAEKIAQISLYGVAAREAYLAAFHAAEALIFERTGENTSRSADHVQSARRRRAGNSP
jgi:uncharacterized protein (UPF0332 family)